MIVGAVVLGTDSICMKIQKARGHDDMNEHIVVEYNDGGKCHLRRTACHDRLQPKGALAPD